MDENRIIEAYRAVTLSISRLTNTFVVFGAFCIFALATPDAELINNSASLNVPFVGPLPFQVVLIVTPTILILIRVVLYVYVKHFYALEKIVKDEAVQNLLDLVPLRDKILSKLLLPIIYVFLPAVLIQLAWKASGFKGFSTIYWDIAIIATCLHIFLFLKRHISVKLSRKGMLFTLACIALGGIYYKNINISDFTRTLSLPRSDLSKQSFINFDFSYADVSYSNLSNSEFVGSKFRDAILTSSLMNNSNFRGADFTETNLYLSDLSDSNFHGGRFEGANLSSAILTRANFENTRLRNTILLQADLSNARLVRADMENADLFLANLENANLKGVINLTCNQLMRSLNWKSTIRSPNLNCGQG